jgi:hypothetical protein
LLEDAATHYETGANKYASMQMPSIRGDSMKALPGERILAESTSRKAGVP